MARPGSEHPTELELEILKILWEESPLPVREVRLRLEKKAKRKLTHSTVITMLNIMYDKGYLLRKKDGKSFLFAPKIKQASVSKGMVHDLLGRVFDGSAKAMMLSLIESTDLDDMELADLKKMINQKVKERKS